MLLGLSTTKTRYEVAESLQNEETFDAALYERYGYGYDLAELGVSCPSGLSYQKTIGAITEQYY